jgi:hypothetical protein
MHVFIVFSQQVYIQKALSFVNTHYASARLRGDDSLIPAGIGDNRGTGPKQTHAMHSVSLTLNM